MRWKISPIFLFLFALIPLLFITMQLTWQYKGSAHSWQYQCIDTMKDSRDNVRTVGIDKPGLAEIAKQMQIIKSLGANCVAIDTPYDEEFVPFLTQWVKAARAQHLHIWFRGNFSAWEGWFGYTHDANPAIELIKTREFIFAHKDLFADGDIFTPATEPENGWGNGYVPYNDYPAFRQFLINEHITAAQAFTKLGKKIKTNWLSLSGGVAKSVLDAPTVQALDNTVTIDHYVTDPQEMKDYIDYFSTTFHAHVVIGEFGAPIPNINGDMNDKQQADFIGKIFNILYQERDVLSGVNYWTLRDSSTEVITKKDQAKPVANTIRSYYQSKNPFN